MGKKNKVKEKKRQQFNAWLVINIVITVIIFSSSFYGFTAFLTHRSDSLHNKIIYALNNGPIRIIYNLNPPYPNVKTFSLSVPQMNAVKYDKLQFSIRGMEGGYPGVVRIELRNQKNETASVVIQGVAINWQRVNIPLEDFKQISDWSNIAEVSFIIESWNAERKKGTVLIDDVCFST